MTNQRFGIGHGVDEPSEQRQVLARQIGVAAKRRQFDALRAKPGFLEQLPARGRLISLVRVCLALRDVPSGRAGGVADQHVPPIRHNDAT